jgi:hypothetical protein
MAKDEFKNLGFSEEDGKSADKNGAAEGKKGELRW